MGVAILQARLVESYELAPEIRHFVFDVPEVEQLPYLPGQFVSFSAELNGKKITRAYSTASAASGNRFELCLNRVNDGMFSPHLFSMRPGDKVDMKGPLGYFTWKVPASDSVLVATGTGIAPFRAMLQSYAGSAAPWNVSLVFGVRYEANLLYREYFEELQRQQPNFRFLPVLSRPNAGWTGLTGHVQEPALALRNSRVDMDYYLCGMKAMVDDLRGRLKEEGLDRKRIVIEKFD